MRQYRVMQRRKQMRQLVYGIITGGIILVTVLVLCGGNTVDKNKKAA